MIGFATRSLRAKVMLVVLATTVSALLFAAFALAIYENDRYEDAVVADVRTQAEILGRVSETALAFDDRRAAAENLAALRLRPQIESAALYDARGALFASYPQSGDAIPTRPAADGHRIDGNHLHYVHPVIAQGQRLGTVYLSWRYEVGKRIADWTKILVVVMLASLLIALAMSAWLQGVVTRPLRDVTDVAKRVIEQRDFSLRASTDTRDEIGVLVHAFNDMLGEVGSRARALEAAYETLQHEIAERRAAEQALRLADRRKDEFLATLAHELRNPLAPLRNGLDMLRLPNVSPDRLAQVHALMARQLAQMVRLVDDLLDVSRISTGKLAVRLQRVELAGIVASAVETTRPLMESRNQRLTIDAPTEPIGVDADPTRRAHVFAKLLNNAPK